MYKFPFLFLLIYILLYSNSGNGQEVLIDLEINPVLYKNYEPARQARLAGNNSKNYFLLDTLELPFIDDFSSSNFKSYNLGDYDENLVVDSIIIDFLVDGEYMDTIDCSLDTTWYFLVDTVLDTTYVSPMLSREIVYFHDPDNPFVPSDTVLCWAPFSLRDTLGVGKNLVDTIVPEILINFRDTLKIYPTDNNSLWIDNCIFLNSTYPVNPPTIGVVTFEGIAENGLPYNFSSTLPEGEADLMTSKPINLGNIAAEDTTVYISFYYQMQGRGNAPESRDSLVLQLKDDQSVWNSVWMAEGGELADSSFIYVLLPIRNSKFFHKGFQIRFKNHATLSGNVDHWHLDFVRLDANRTENDTIEQDVAFVEPLASLLNHFESIPWKHFQQNPDSLMNDSINVLIRNNSDESNNVFFRYEIYEENNMLFGLDAGSSDMPPYALCNNHNFCGEDRFDNQLDYVYPSNNEDSAQFEVRAFIRPDLGDLLTTNDTLRYFQRFYNYYAYDDGTAENGYGLNVEDGKVAYRFDLLKPDTLRAVNMYFNPMLNDVSIQTFQLAIWEGSDRPETMIYLSDSLFRPAYSGGLNGFQTYFIEDTLIELSGTFFVGWLQHGEELLNIGLDRNRISNQNMFYNIQGDDVSWINSLFSGSWMIRPMFGQEFELPVAIQEEKPVHNLAVYPNPVTNILYLSGLSNYHGNSVVFYLYDLSGRQVGTYPGNQTSIDVSSLSGGIYLLRMVDNGNGMIETRKVVVQR